MNHTQLIKMGQGLGYKGISDEGLCLGFSEMWAQAVCANDLEAFKSRLTLMDEYKDNPERLNQDIEALRNQIKEQGGDVVLSERGRILLEIPAFFEGIALYLSPFLYEKVFESKLIQRDSETVSTFVTPKTGDSGGMRKAFSTLDQYNEAELSTFLQRLSARIVDHQDVALVISTHTHAVSARPLGNGLFEYIDTNSNVGGEMTHWEGDAAGLAQELFKSLKHTLSSDGEESYLAFDCDLMVPAGKLDQFNLDDLHNTNPIRILHNNDDGSNLLHIAADKNDDRVLKRIIPSLVDINQATTSWETPLGLAVDNRSYKVFDSLLNMEGLNLDSGLGNDAFSFSALSLLAKQQDDEALLRAGQLIERGASLKFTDSKEKSPLHEAIVANNERMVLFLIEHGANLNGSSLYSTLDSIGFESISPLQLAAMTGKHAIVNLLIKAGADCNIKTLDGSTALSLACRGKHAKIVADLLPLTKISTQDPMLLAPRFDRSNMLGNVNKELRKQIVEKGLSDYIDQLHVSKSPGAQKTLSQMKNSLKGSVAVYLEEYNQKKAKFISKKDEFIARKLDFDEKRTADLHSVEQVIQEKTEPALIKQAELKARLDLYIDERNSESDLSYEMFGYGYSKEDKIKAATQLLNVLNNMQRLTPDDLKALKSYMPVLTDGRLGVIMRDFQAFLPERLKCIPDVDLSERLQNGNYYKDELELYPQLVAIDQEFTIFNEQSRLLKAEESKLLKLDARVAAAQDLQNVLNGATVDLKVYDRWFRNGDQALDSLYSRYEEIKHYEDNLNNPDMKIAAALALLNNLQEENIDLLPYKEVLSNSNLTDISQQCQALFATTSAKETPVDQVELINKFKSFKIRSIEQKQLSSNTVEEPIEPKNGSGLSI